MIIVGVVGKAGAGKDTIADYLVEKYGYVKLALAGPLKKGVQEIFAIDDKTMYDRELRELELEDFPGWSSRMLLQFIGTELFREKFDKDIWVKVLMKRIRQLGHDKVVVSDVRFPNEFDFISGYSDAKTAIIEVLRKETDVGDSVGIKNHESEAHKFEADYVIENDGSLKDLYNKVDEWKNEY